MMMSKKINLLFSLMLMGGSMTYAQSWQKVHEKAILIDTHGDILTSQAESGIDIGKLQNTGNFDLVRAKQGGLDVQIFSVWSDESGNFNVALKQIDSLDAVIKRYPKAIALARTAAETRTLVKQQKLAALIGVEGGHMIDDRLENIDILAKRGMKYLTLTWNNSTSWATSAADESSGKLPYGKAGLNDFGKQVVKRLNDLNVMVDLSHVGERTFYDALAVTTKPVILSHSSVYAINPVPRNITDDQIRAVAKNGGVICVNFYSGFLDADYRKRLQAFTQKYSSEFAELRKQMNRNEALNQLLSKYRADAEANVPPGIDKLIDHIDHIVKLVGVDYVGLGADFDGAESFPKGMLSVADYPKLTQALMNRGYKAKDVEKILGANVLRVLESNDR